MSDRVPRSVNFDKDHLEWMDENIGNRSEFINDLVKQYRQGTSEMNEAVARFRREQLRSQKASLETRLESIESELEGVEKSLTTQEQEKQEELDALIDVALSQNAQLTRETPRLKRLASEYFSGSTSEALESVEARANARDDVTQEVVQ